MYCQIYRTLFIFLTATGQPVSTQELLFGFPPFLLPLFPSPFPGKVLGECESGAVPGQGQQNFHKHITAWHKEDAEGATTVCTAKSTCGNPRNVNQETCPKSPDAVLIVHLAYCVTGQTALSAAWRFQPVV